MRSTSQHLWVTTIARMIVGAVLPVCWCVTAATAAQVTLPSSIVTDITPVQSQPAATARAVPNVAVLVSDFKSGVHSADERIALEALGWDYTTYKNTNFPQLLADLPQYDVVIFSTVFNYDGKADLASGADRLREFVRRGGALILNDLNYANQTDWLPELDPRAIWEVKDGALNPHPDVSPTPARPDIPLLAGTEYISAPWSQTTRTGSQLVPLLVDADGKLVSACLRIGKGVVVFSTLYHQMGWPGARFLDNLVRWLDGTAPRVTEYLDVVLTEPAFRGQIQSKDPTKRIAVRGTYSCNDTSGQLIRVSLEKNDCDTVVWQQTVVPDASGAFSLTRSADELKTGEYSLVVSAGQQRHQEAVRVLPPADTEVTFDARGVGYVNGEHIFPIAMFHVSPLAVDATNKAAAESGAPTITVDQMLRDVKRIGINTILHNWRLAGGDWLTRARKEQLWVIPAARVPEGHFVTTIDLARQLLRQSQPADVIPMWYGVDEPQGRKLIQARQMREVLGVIDPHRAVGAAVNHAALLEYTLDVFDVYMPDAYLIHTRRDGGPVDLRPLRDSVERACRHAGRQVPYWPVLQSFTYYKYDRPEPTDAELRAQAYSVLASGATGIFWYSYYTHESYAGAPHARNHWLLSDYPDTMDALAAIHHELQEWIPVVLNGRSGPSLQCSNDRIITRCWSYQNKLYVLAVNAVAQPVRVVLEGTAGRAVMQLHEAAHMSFAPLQVRSWILDMSMVNPVSAQDD